MNNNDDGDDRQVDVDRVKAITGRSSRSPKNVSADKAPETPAPSNVLELAKQLEPITYFYKNVDDFLNIVFHSPLSDREHVACYFDEKYQGFPIEREPYLTKLRRTQKPAKLYFATATVSKDPVKGVILNRAALFERAHVIVLDDIGTKIPLSNLPEGFEPTYIIESSPNNFQYGYVFDEPIEDYEQARALIELVYGADPQVTDAGGKLVNKKVRLPDGINGKEDKPYTEFRVNLKKDDGPYWSPQAILDALSIPTKWSDVVEDAAAARRLNSKVVGTSLYSPLNAQNASLNGVIDPVMEWLTDNDMLLNFDSEWACIVCPWANLHSDGDIRAYYSPLGISDDPKYIAHRAYKCQHSHNKTDKTQQFLAHVAEQGGPLVAGYDPAGELVASHVYDSQNDTVWGIKEHTLRSYKSTGGFKNAYPEAVQLTALNKKGKGELKSTTLGSLFMTNPARVMVDGVTFDPTTTARILREKGQLRLNSFSPPDWGSGPYDMNIVNTFIDYLAYLIPDEEERETFTDWLACKVQNMGFRGWGMMMIAKTHGMGRGTLSQILTKLFEDHNVADVPFAELLEPSDGFNEWQSKLLVISNEAANFGDMGSFYKQYTQLKELIDTTPKRVTINNKYGLKVSQKLCTSHLIFTQYEDASAIEEGDRRMYVITNAAEPASEAYFEMINAWQEACDKNGNFTFVNHLARWLKARPVDLSKMNGRAPNTAGKSTMIEANKSAMDVFTSAFIDALPTPYSTFDMFKALVFKNDARLDHPTDSLIRRLYDATTNPVHAKNTLKIDGKNVRVRVLHRGIPTDCLQDVKAIRSRHLLDKPADRLIRRRLLDAIDQTDIIAIGKAVAEQLDLASY